MTFIWKEFTFRNSHFMIPFGFRFDGSFRISEGPKSLGIQMIETILHVGLYQLFLKEINKIYSSITKSAKQTSNFATRASFVLVLRRGALMLSRVVSSFTRVLLCRVVSCCTPVVSYCLMLCSCCVVLSCVLLVLSRIVSCCIRVVSCCLVS